MKMQFLPESDLLDPEQSELYGVTLQAPKEEAVLLGPGASRGDVRSRTGIIHRKHWSAGQRAAVRDYFKED